MKKTFDITGMTCTSCASHVEKAVKKLSGTSSAVINLMQNTLQIEYDNTVQSVDDIIKAVVDAGYGASLKKNTSTTNSVDHDLSVTKKESHAIFKKLWISSILLLPLMYIAMGEMFNFPLPTFLSGPQHALNFAIIQFLLAFAICYINRSYFYHGFKNLWRLSPTMDSLIAIGASAAMLYGTYAIVMIQKALTIQDFTMVHMYQMDLYFESAGTILALITLGKYLETKSKGKTSDAIAKLMDLTPKTALVEKDGIIKEVHIEDVLKGDIVIIKSGNAIPVDGIIVDGSASVDESMLSGESLPLDKTIDDRVSAATINLSGYFKMKATHVGEETTISNIIKLVESANTSKAPIAKLADKVSNIFVPVVMLISLFSTLAWLYFGYSVSFSLSIGIAVLIISCPCALGLATPTAIMVGTGKGAELGILFKTAESLEVMQSIDIVALDKTGTLTKGKPSVSNMFVSENSSASELLQIAYNAEYVSEHPLAKAIIEKAEEQHLSVENHLKFVQLAGKGIVVEMQNYTIFAGNAKLMENEHIDISAFNETAINLSNEGQTPLYFAKNKQLVGMIAVSDTLKKSSKQAIDELHALGIQVVMLSGDNQQTAKAIASQLGIERVIADVLPQDKAQHIKALKKTNKKVAMVGDGINDAVALVQADIGIAIGAGNDIAIESADIVLMHSDVLDVVTTYQLSKSTLRNIKENLFWAFFYNIIGIPIAAGILHTSFSIKLNPMFAAAAMAFSSVFVVLNALRLQLFKTKFHQKQNTKENVS
ncbi:MAG: heavy metal translocating P-type ATPase [Breznakia sp.]